MVRYAVYGELDYSYITGILFSSLSVINRLYNVLDLP
jgi:hypothetical protein